MFITFEGPEGSGKTTQARMLATALEILQCKVVLTREPGGTLVGEEIRKILLGPLGKDLDPKCILLLFSAARAQLVRHIIKPAIDSGKIVICDRYADSTRAYQWGGDGIPRDEVERAIQLGTEGLEPDITFYLDLSPEEGLRRRRTDSARGAESGWNSMDARELEFHQRVREAYLSLAKEYSSRFYVIDATRRIEDIHRTIIEIVNKKLQSRIGGKV